MNFPKILNARRLRDHSVEPPIESIAYPVFVQSTDADGNAFGGIRHPMSTPLLATHAGWSLRASGYGEGDLFTIQGSMIPFAATEAERQRAGDPRAVARSALRIARGLGCADCCGRRIASSPSDYRYPRTAIGCWQRPTSRGTLCQAL